MYGLLEVFSLYSVKFVEVGNQLTAYTKGNVAEIDQRKLLGNGWTKVTDHEFYILVEPEEVEEE
jgi:hypothetical protein